MTPLNTDATTINSVNSNWCNFIIVTGSQFRTTQKVHCRNITLENATIPSGVTLELIATEQPRAAYCANAEGRASLHLPWWANKICPTGGKLELKSEGSVSYNSNFTVETGANFINY